MALVRMRRAKKSAKRPKTPNRRIVEGPLQLLAEDGKSTKVWVVLTSQFLVYGKTRQDTPSCEIRISDIVSVHQNGQQFQKFDSAVRADRRASQPDKEVEVEGSFPTSIVESYRLKQSPSIRDVDAAALAQDEDFLVGTYPEGYFRGRPFIFRAADSYERDVWWRCLSKVFRNHDAMMKESEEEMERYTSLGRLRRYIRGIYLGDRCQIFVAFLVSSIETMSCIGG